MIYLDYNASTRVDPRVLEAMLPYFSDVFANAASTDHAAGHAARAAVEEARGQVASLVGGDADEIVFTAGATEADNIAVLGVMARAGDDAELVTTAIEHPAVLEPARQLGARAKLARVGADGVVEREEVARLLTQRTALVSVMTANNETGAIQPVADIGALCAERGIPFHTDAVQAAARLPLDVRQMNAALMSLSAHKMYGPKGVGALYVRRRPRVKLRGILYGGGHERNLRPGTLNVPAIVGLGVAAGLVREERERETARLLELRERLLAGLAALGAVVNVDPKRTLAQTVNVRFDVDARALLHRVGDRVAFATGSACATISNEPSHVLVAQGLDARAVGQSCRFSFGRFTTAEDIDAALAALSEAVLELRQVATRAA